MLRPAEERDVEAMRTWRNQDANREVSINRHVITPEENRAFWDRVRNDPTRRVMVFEYDGRALGIVNYFDISPDSASWGFFLDHDTVTAEGTALLAWMQVMKDAIGYAFDVLGVDVLHAEVFPENESVRAMNRRFRFVEGDPETRRAADGTDVTIIPISLRREDRRGARKKDA